MSLKEKYQADGSSYEISLSKLFGKPVKDVLGYISTEFNGHTFKLTNIVMEDGSVFWAEGEHDFPYITNGTGIELDEELMKSIYEEENKDDEEEGEF